MRSPLEAIVTCFAQRLRCVRSGLRWKRAKTPGAVAAAFENAGLFKVSECLLPHYGLLSYGQLRLHPFWDPLRGDPRFEKLVEESKKPVALK